MPVRKQYLLVDGYNVVHAWPQTRALLPRDIDAAAELLVERLAVLHDPERFEVTVVFDGKSDRTEIVSDGSGSIPGVIYAKSGRSADAVIEEIVAKAPDPSAFTVVSRDNALGTSTFSSGAQVIGPDALLDMVRRERRSIAADSAVRKSDADKKFGNRIF
jgi:predicted RNA-binding protein with PIN domain